MRLKYLQFAKMFENVLKKLINSYLNFKKKKMSLPLMEKKTLIERKSLKMHSKTKHMMIRVKQAGKTGRSENYTYQSQS